MLEFMKKKILIPLLIIAALGGFLAFRQISTEGKTVPETRRQLILSTIMKAVNEGHYSPRALDDSFSARIWNRYLTQLDYGKQYFTAPEIQSLKKYQFAIDDELKTGASTFFDAADAYFTKGIDRAEGYVQAALKSPFTFTANDSIMLQGDKLDYAANDAALQDRWRKAMKYRVLLKYVELKDAQDKDTTGAKKKADAALEAEAREAIAKSQKTFFRRMHKLDEAQRFALYVNAITGSEDPHTDYFPPKDKQRFDEAMAGSFSGIGAQLKEEEGKIQITAIIPGSPSWKQGELKANDEIIKVGQGTAEPEDVQGWDLEDVVSKIRGKKGTEVRLTVRRPDGAQKVIPITRGDVLIEETFAKSALIEGKNGPIGYITLPEFYADFTVRNGRHSAPDVAVEIEKLKQAGAKSIIFDVRNNGGGSLSDVVDIVGFFIDKGPVVQVKSSQAAPMTLRDEQGGTLFDGPLIVMINNGSASASEILAAAIQDYNRGLIVGTNSFGKGTVQKVIGLEEVLDPLTRMKLAASGDLKMNSSGDQSLGALKLTMQKFYRVNGGSTQLRGVAPDVVLPDAYELLDEIGERRDKSALPWDQIAPLAIRKENKVSNIPALAARSKARLDKNEAFRLIETSAKKMKAREEGKAFPLNEKAYRQELTEANALNKRLEEIEKAGTPISVSSLKADEVQINRDSTTVKKNEDWLKALKKDVYLSETVQIMNDMAGR